MINQIQRNVLIAVAVIITGMLLYPPFHRIYANGITEGAGYHWLFDAPHLTTVDIGTLLVQWLEVLIIGGIAFFIFKDKQGELKCCRIR
ncbi:MAG: hypothetical protein OXU96_00630 [Gammaproteobacteria bacterium]|nr:hypothetical protein [Gammaproteobacteria bacterium]